MAHPRLTNPLMADDASKPTSPCPECERLRAALAAALKRIDDLEAEVRRLGAQLNRNSSNSSVPPSSDPPDAPKPVVKTPTGRRSGAQPGHPGHQKPRLPA